MIGKEYIILYILVLVFDIWYILKKKKQMKEDNNPMDYVRLYQAYASFFFITILLILSIFK